MTTNYQTVPPIISPLVTSTMPNAPERSQQDEARRQYFQGQFTRAPPGHVRRNGGDRSYTSTPTPLVDADSVNGVDSASETTSSESARRRDSPVRAPGGSGEGGRRVFQPLLPPRAESLNDCTSDAAALSPRRLTTTARRTMTVRALFDYDPATDTDLPSRGLPFHHGDILLVVNANDPEWWQARRLVCPAHNQRQQFFDSSTHIPAAAPRPNSLGLIPSRRRIERRHHLRTKHVSFFTRVTVIDEQAGTRSASSTRLAAAVDDQSKSVAANSNGNGVEDGAGSQASGSPSPLSCDGQSPMFSLSTLDRPSVDETKVNRSSSLPRTLFKRLSLWNRKKAGTMPSSVMRTNSADTVCGDEEYNTIRSYEVVVPHGISMLRPLLIFGPLKETVIDTLLRDPTFAPCVPHTSRPPRPGERDGHDYHFMPSRAAMEAEVASNRFIEVGQFQGHLYATSLEAVVHTLKSGRVCILDLSLAAIRRLELAGLHPMSVLVKPRSVLHLRAIQRRLTEEQAKRSLDIANRLEAENWRVFSAIITYDTIESAVKAIQSFTAIHGGPMIWVNSTGHPSGMQQSPLIEQGSQSSCLPRSADLLGAKNS